MVVAQQAPRPRVGNAMVKALARTFRWREMLDKGVHATLEDLAKANYVAPSFVSRVMRLTLLAPEIVEAILDGTQGPELTLARFMESFPAKWSSQGGAVGLRSDAQEALTESTPRYS
jgi:hypothetical protein